MSVIANTSNLNTYGLTYEWKLNSLKIQNTANLSNVITSVSWTLTGTDANGYSGMFNGVTPLGPPDSNNFIQLTTMNANTVISMIESEIANNSSYIQHIDDQIYSQIQLNYVLETSLQGNSLPWAANTYTV